MRQIVFLTFIFFNTLLNAQYSDTIHLNDVRVLASHNSYKKQPDPKILKFLERFKKRLGEANDPKQIEYEHVTLTEQLDSFDIRGFELDVNYDPKGGRYYKRRINGFIGGLKKRSKIEELKEPGYKIIHITDVDYETNYLTFKAALKEINDWSNANPEHLPIYINIEAKGSGLGDESKMLKLFGFKTALEFDSIAFSDLDKEIYESIDSDKLYTPKQLRGDYQSIKERLDNDGWPLLNTCAGKLIFILQGTNSNLYTKYIDAGQDRPMFVYGVPGEMSTAFVIRNQPKGNVEEIDSLSEQYIVRTRSDAGTLDARANDYSRWNEAMRSNAQIISTDYYKPNLEFSGFFVEMPYELMLRETR